MSKPPPPSLAAALADLTGIAAALIEAAPDAVFVVDAGGTIVLVNDQAERMLGFAREELLGQPIETIIRAEDRAAHVRSRTSYAAAPSRRSMGLLEVRAQRKDGGTVWMAISLSPVVVDGHRLIIATGRDVSDRRALDERLRYLSCHDALTGLASRGHFDEELARLDGGRGFPIAVIVADLDGLKARNDRDGHGAGDQLLRETAAVLRAAFRSEDLLARLGGDEFAIVLPGSDRVALEAAVARVREKAAAAGLSLSLGGAIAEAAGGLGRALKEADLRMYDDKAGRRSRRRDTPTR